MEERKPQHVIVNGSVAKQVTAIMTQQIIDGKFKVGDYLPTEEDLCSEFGIGRSSVREAIKTLESRGLVRKLQGKGVVVIDEITDAIAELLTIAINYKNISIHDMVDFRESLEVQLAQQAAIKATDENVANIKVALDAMRLNIDSYDELAEWDHIFHEKIAEASGNSVSILIMKSLRPALQMQIKNAIESDFEPQHIIDIHEVIFNAIASHQPKVAGKEMAAHLKETHRVLLNK